MNVKDERVKWSYFGIEVEILVCLNHCSLVRYRGREFVVDMTDLISERTLVQAA